MLTISTATRNRGIPTWGMALASLLLSAGCQGASDLPEYVDPPRAISESFEGFVYERLPLVDSLMRVHPHRWLLDEGKIAGAVRIVDLGTELWLGVERMPEDAPADYVHIGLVAIEVPLRSTRWDDRALEGENRLYLEFWLSDEGVWRLVVENGFPISPQDGFGWANEKHDFHPRIMAGLLDIFPETIEYWDSF